MIKKFNTYNESLKGKLKGKSEKEVKKGLNNLLIQIKKESENPEMYTEGMFYYLKHIFKTDKEILNVLIDNNILNASDIIETLCEDFDHIEFKTIQQKKYKIRVMKGIYDLIEKNIDNFDIAEYNLM